MSFAVDTPRDSATSSTEQVYDINVVRWVIGCLGHGLIANDTWKNLLDDVVNAYRAAHAKPRIPDPDPPDVDMHVLSVGMRCVCVRLLFAGTLPPKKQQRCLCRTIAAGSAFQIIWV